MQEVKLYKSIDELVGAFFSSSTTMEDSVGT